MADIAVPMAEWRRTVCGPAGVPSVQGWRSGSYSDDRFSRYKRDPTNTAITPIQRMTAIPGICAAKGGMFMLASFFGVDRSGLVSPPVCPLRSGCSGRIWSRLR